MQKKILENFISKYNIAGEIEAVTWTSDGSKLSVGFASANRNAVGYISTDMIDIPAGEYAVFDTAVLRSLLSVLGDDLTVVVDKDKGGQPHALTIKDGFSKVKFILADPSIIPSAPELKNFPTPEVSIKIDQKFLTAFVKGCGALRDMEAFTVISDGTQARVVLGFSTEHSQNSVSINVEAVDNAILAPINFASLYFKDILLANKDMKEGEMRISSKGLAHIRFTIDNFKTDYYLTRVS
jgi:hypothetical protein